MTDHPDHPYTDPTTLEEAHARLAQVEEAIAAIRTKLDAARAEKIKTGVYADAQWFARAKAALRFKGMEHQRLQRACARLARERRTAQARSFEQAFVDAARKLLPADLFQSIADQAQAGA